MKRIVFYLAFACLSVVSAMAVTLGGVAYDMDTLSHYQAGPGTWYTQVRMYQSGTTQNRRDVYILQVDRRNPYVSVQTVLSNDSLEKGECPSEMAKRKSQPGKRYFAGTNGDWWSTTRPGVPEGAFVTENTIAITPWNGRATLAMCAIDQHDSLYFGHDFFTDVVLCTTTDTVRCSHVNDICYEDELVLYNAYNGHCTHTDNSGTEVLCRIDPATPWGTNTIMRAEVLRVEAGKGNMRIEDGCFVLSARDGMQQHLQALTVGQQIELHISTSINGIYADFKAALGGQDRTFMLVNGVVDNNWDERHPRTGLGFSLTGDTVIHCVVDGRGKSVGATTGELAEIMQFFGAYNAMNMEGGGSSSMNLALQGVMNVPSDGHERAESQGIFAVSSAPDDDVISRIEAYEPSVQLPKYGVSAPAFLGYNQYDMLLDIDVQGVRLSCDETVGYIDANGHYVCLASGDVRATKDGIGTTIHVQLVDEAPIAFRLDSVMQDGLHPYTVEVEAIVGTHIMGIRSDALSWTSSAPSVAAVNDAGEVIGLQNGYAEIIGELGDFRDTLLVHVQIPTARTMMWDDFRTPDTWTLKCPSTYKPQWVALESEDAPVDLQFTYKNGRERYIRLSKNAPLYSMPDTIRLVYATDALVENFYLSVRADNELHAQNITFKPSVEVGTDRVADVVVKDFFGTDVAIFPLHFECINFSLQSSTPAGAHHFWLKGISLHYDVNNTSGMEQTVVMPVSSYTIWRDGQLYIVRNGVWYNMLGTIIKQ